MSVRPGRQEASPSFLMVDPAARIPVPSNYLGTERSTTRRMHDVSVSLATTGQTWRLGRMTGWSYRIIYARVFEVVVNPRNSHDVKNARCSASKQRLREHVWKSC